MSACASAKRPVGVSIGFVETATHVKVLNDLFFILPYKTVSQHVIFGVRARSDSLQKKLTIYFARFQPHLAQSSPKSRASVMLK